MNSLVYLTYGQGPHIDELVFSVLSALHMIGPDSTDYRIIVYTDNPSLLGDLPVQKELISAKDLVDWSGPLNFNHRRKIFAIKHALQQFGGRLVYCDADTYFLKHPSKVFSRIRPGHAVMHLREGQLNSNNGLGLEDFLDKNDLHELAGPRWDITRHTQMFNAGVIGLHEADIGLLDEVVYLTDQIYSNVKIHTIEQFAFSACLSRRITLRECYDVIYHYWPMPNRALFQDQLRRFLRESNITSHEDCFRQLLPHRPRQSQKRVNRPPESLTHRVHVALWELARRTHVLIPLKKVRQVSRNYLGC